MTKQTINRALARADHIAPEVLRDVQGTSLDKGVELDALAKLPADQQRQLADRAMAGEQVSARGERPPAADDEDIVTKQVRKLASAWLAASEAARRAFVDQYVTPANPATV